MEQDLQETQENNQKNPIQLPIDFKGKFESLKETMEKQEVLVKDFNGTFEKISKDLEKYNIPSQAFFGSVVDIEAQWKIALDTIKKMLTYFEHGFDNKDILELNRFITTCDSFERTNECLKNFSGLIETMQNQLIEFNNDLGNYQIDGTIKALRQQQNDLIAVANNNSENIERITDELLQTRIRAIDNIGTQIDANFKSIIKKNNELLKSVDALNAQTYQKIETFRKGFNKKLEVELVSWGDVNIKNYRKFTRFAFGFYAFNFGLAFILGALLWGLYSTKETYKHQISLLRQSSEAYKTLLQVGNFQIDKKENEKLITFNTSSNLAITKTNNGFLITLKEGN